MADRILFVDDEHLIRRAFTRAMGYRGFGVDLADGADEALALAREKTYGVIATDYMMPKMDGLTLIGELEVVQPEAAFVIVTGLPHRLPSVPGRAVMDVVIKPWDNQLLATTLRRAMERHRQLLSRGATPAGSVLLAAEGSRGAALHRLFPADLAARATVCGVEGALALLGERDFDVVVLDLRDDVEQRLRQLVKMQELAPHLPILVLGAEYDDQLAIQAIHAGAQDYLAQDAVDPDALARAICFAIERKRHEHRLIYRAHFDPLTGLANRGFLEEQLARTISRANRNSALAGVLFADLDGFKAINDEHGHEIGDLLLQQVAGRLRGLVRDFETVARLGGDEFAVVLSDLTQRADAAVVAARICENLAQPFFVEDLCLRVSTSVGIASFPQDGQSSSELLKCADEAMYRAKKGGRNGYRFYNEPLGDVDLVTVGVSKWAGGSPASASMSA